MSYSEVLKEVSAPVIRVAPGHRGTYRTHLQEWKQGSPDSTGTISEDLET